jgi:hypothetical protein
MLVARSQEDVPTSASQSNLLSAVGRETDIADFASGAKQTFSFR